MSGFTPWGPLQVLTLAFHTLWYSDGRNWTSWALLYYYLAAFVFGRHPHNEESEAESHPNFSIQARHYRLEQIFRSVCSMSGELPISQDFRTDWTTASRFGLPFLYGLTWLAWMIFLPRQTNRSAHHGRSRLLPFLKGPLVTTLDIGKLTVRSILWLWWLSMTAPTQSELLPIARQRPGAFPNFLTAGRLLYNCARVLHPLDDKKNGDRFREFSRYR